MDKIIIKGARENNLKNIDITIPRDKFVVFTGLSGSGKSSLAFDTIYAEGQRRYVESLSSYARQFLGQMEKPDVDSISGLSPAISIDQKTTAKNPRSTVGTVTEIYDYLRLLYARIGVAHCPKCGKRIQKQTIDQMVDKICALPERTKIQVLAPVVRGRKGEYQKVLEGARKSGYVRVRIDGSMYELSEEIKLDKNKKHNIELVIDRLIMKEGIKQRLTDSLETVMRLTGGIVLINVLEGEDVLFSQNYACEDCGVNLEELTPRSFSFNNHYGACPTCMGIGSLLKIDPMLLVRDRKKSLAEGAIYASGWGVAPDSMAMMYYKGLAKAYKFSVDTPFEKLSDKVKDIIFYGSRGKKITFAYPKKNSTYTFEDTFEGIVNNLERRYKETSSDWTRRELEAYMSSKPCPDCGGKRLKPEILSVTVGGKNIHEVCTMSIVEAKEFFAHLTLTPREEMIARLVLREINERLGFLVTVGLGYLTLARGAATLSGGESQRIRLATQIGSGLTGVLYILDEPSIGLHQRDNDKLLGALRHLCDLGNTLIVVEHDEDTMYAADYIVDIGPGAGVHGGQVVAAGSVEDIKACPESITGQYLSGVKKIEVPEKTRKLGKKFLTIKGASENNLKNIDVKIPLGVFTCVTGVSGSGKSSLVNEIVYKYLARVLNGARQREGKFQSMKGVDNLDKIINIDQSPIGRTPRSNPATYTGVFTDIRNLFAATNDAKMRGYQAGRFSFNVSGGRCEACSGDGIVKIEMHFLPDIYVPCEVCKGKRYNRETLEVRYKGKNIHEVLDMTVEEALTFFENIPSIKRRLQALYDVGLSYIKLGQSSTTLSGGEAQRVKLATELGKRGTGKTIYVLDEPTTGLHTADVHRLIDVMQRLVDAGNTVLVIEHNLDVIKTADYIIDLGPEGGSEGGSIVATGTPKEVSQNENSYTGHYLKKYFQ